MNNYTSGGGVKKEEEGDRDTQGDGVNQFPTESLLFCGIRDHTLLEELR